MNPFSSVSRRRPPGALWDIVGIGIGKLAAAAMEGSARQPSAIGDIRTSMIIAAALIEGATLFAIVVCLLLAIAK
jgi:F-type H+-transporting ATPase subunit c